MRYLPGFRENFGDLEVKTRLPVKLEAKKHASADLSFTIDNAIRGRIISPTGKPMQNVCVYAVASDAERGRYDDSGCSNEKGEFEITDIAPENYVLVVNRDEKISDEEPFGKLFYPGVVDRKLASVVSITAGKFLSGINIQIPQAVELIEISGRFLYADEKPVAAESVIFKPANGEVYEQIRAQTDKLGRFTLKIPKGASGTLSGEKYFFWDDIKNCPKIKEIKDANTGSTKSNEIELDGNESLSAVELVFSFPFCAKPED